MKNKRAASAMFIVLAVFYFFACAILYQYFKPDISIARDATQMNCDAPSTPGDMGVCLIIDFIIPYIIIGFIAAALAIATKGGIG